MRIAHLAAALILLASIGHAADAPLLPAYSEVRPGVTLSFPRDHGAHPEFRTEWWYFTGNLATQDGRHFGFELTFFRYALAPATARQQGASAWRADQVWMAHFAITDTQGNRFVARERLTREALGLAGASSEPLQIWV